MPEITNPEIEVKTVVQALTDSWNRHDMPAYAARFTEDADFVNVLGMHMKGRAAIEAQHVAIHRTIFRNSTLRTLECSVRLLSPSVALAHVHWEMTGHEPVAGWNADIRKGVLTAALVQQNGRWLVTALQNTDVVSVHLRQSEP